MELLQEEIYINLYGWRPCWDSQVRLCCSGKKNNPTQSGKYVKMKKMTFSALDYGTSEIDLWSIVEK